MSEKEKIEIVREMFKMAFGFAEGVGVDVWLWQNCEVCSSACVDTFGYDCGEVSNICGEWKEPK